MRPSPSPTPPGPPERAVPATAVADRLAALRTRLAEARRASGRTDEVRLLLVTKHVEAERVAAALAAGQRAFGESRLQELDAKREQLAGALPPPRWEFVGRVQRNKARGLVGRVALIHSVDRARLVDALDSAAVRAEVVQPVLLQVNVDGDPAKAGVAPSEVAPLLARLHQCSGLRCNGLMTVPAADGDPRRAFAVLRALRDALCRDHPDCRDLSMGMSADLEAAVGEGATVVRVGRAVFGPRPATAPTTRKRTVTTGAT